MAALEQRYCLLTEYQTGIEGRFHEEEITLNGLYSLWMRLKPGHHQAIVTPALVKDIQTGEGTYQVDLGLVSTDMSIKGMVQLAMGDGIFTGFGTQLNTCPTHQQLIETGYLTEWQSGDVGDRELRSFLSGSTMKMLDLTAPSLEPALVTP